MYGKKICGTYNTDMAYEELANAIILQAVNDYRTSLRSLKRNKRNSQADLTRKEIDVFFQSDWFEVLTTINGKELIKKVKKEITK